MASGPLPSRRTLRRLNHGPRKGRSGAAGLKTLDVEIAHLRDLDVRDLQARWRNTFRRARLLTCPAIFCFVFSPIGSRLIDWAIWIPKVGGCWMVRVPRMSASAQRMRTARSLTSGRAPFLPANGTAGCSQPRSPPIAGHLQVSGKFPVRKSAWWRTQSLSNRSRIRNSLLTGKRTGNFADFGRFSAHSTTRRRANSSGFRRIPCETEQGISLAKQGSFSEQGRRSRKRPFLAHLFVAVGIAICSRRRFADERERDGGRERRPWTRQGEAFWRAHHEAWKRSDLNQREYCEAQGIPLKAFGNWRAKFKAEPQPPERKLLYRRGGLSHPLSPQSKSLP